MSDENLKPVTACANKIAVDCARIRKQAGDPEAQGGGAGSSFERTLARIRSKLGGFGRRQFLLYVAWDGRPIIYTVDESYCHEISRELAKKLQAAA